MSNTKDLFGNETSGKEIEYVLHKFKSMNLEDFKVRFLTKVHPVSRSTDYYCYVIGCKDINDD